MPRLSIDELKNLIERTQGPCVSVYMPTQKAGPDTRQNPIRFKNLMREVEERLDGRGIDPQAATGWLKPASELDRADFWENQDHGLVVFVSPDVFRYYRLPIEVPELVDVAEHFHLKPLVPLLTNNGRFYILALSQDEVRLMEGTRSRAQEVEVENMPKSMAEALQYYDTSKEGQFRIATSRGGTSNSFQQPGAFHGQGSPGQDKEQRDILQFFQLVDEALHEKLRNQKAPLVLAGVEYLLPIYQEANTYPHLMKEGITGNPEILKPEELHDRAWPIVEPLFQQPQQEALELYQELAGTDSSKASSDLKEIISAAYYQRVDSLFVAEGYQQWGQFDPENMAVHLHPEPEGADEDMLDFATVHTLLNGGTVYELTPEKMPDQTSAAAILRY